MTKYVDGKEIRTAEFFVFDIFDFEWFKDESAFVILSEPVMYKLYFHIEHSTAEKWIILE